MGTRGGPNCYRFCYSFTVTPRLRPSPEPPLPDRPLRAESVADLVTHAVYRIATGAWAEGERMPSVRAAERLWGVDRRRVLAAYGRLEELGLVVRRPRSGFRVAGGARPGRLARHRAELERLFERFAREVEKETGLAPLGVFRWFTHLAAIRSQERPSVAFVECTGAQARAHAEEVFARLGVPCLALTLDELARRAADLPPSLRTLLVSGFHLAEVRALALPGALEVLGVAIEVDPAATRDLPATVAEALLLDRDAAEAADIAADLARIGLAVPVSSLGVPEAGAFLAGQADAPGAEGTLFLLAPRLWGGVDGRWQVHPRVRQAAFRVPAEAWPAVADGVGLPLGYPAGGGR